MSADRIATTALVIIDVQESFRHAPFWNEDELPAFKSAILRLDQAARAQGIPVVHVFHVGANPPFTKETGLVRLQDWVPGEPDAVFEKHTHNAFTDTGLDLWLRRRGVNRLVITGIRTEQCCETTTRVGSDMGYAVDFVTEATLTFPMTHPTSGRVYTADEIKARCELVLHGRFARIATVDQVLADWNAVVPA
jgi:nicotinamidase-related amidase